MAPVEPQPPDPVKRFRRQGGSLETAPRKPLLGVSVCALRAGEALMVERRKAPFAGLLSLPGGRVEWGEPLTEAARRELREETGLAVEALAFQQFHEVIGEDRHAVIAVFRAVLPDEARPIAADDAAAIRFVAIEDLDRLESAGRTTPGLAAIVRSAADALSR